MSETPNRKLRMFHPGVLALMAAVLLITYVLSAVWLPYLRNREAIAEFERLGGYAQVLIIRPFWIPGAVDDEYFERITEASLSGTHVGDVELEFLGGLDDLQFLYLSRTQIGDAGLERLGDLSALQWLILDSTEVSDDGLEHLPGLTNLRRLSLVDTKVSDAGLAHLRQLPNLQWLSLDDTQVSDAGLEHLRELSNLRYLRLGGTQVTEAGVESLQKTLSNCRISWTSR